VKIGNGVMWIRRTYPNTATLPIHSFLYILSYERNLVPPYLRVQRQKSKFLISLAVRAGILRAESGKFIPLLDLILAIIPLGEMTFDERTIASIFPSSMNILWPTLT
jgi:hypothetical protein